MRTEAMARKLEDSQRITTSGVSSAGSVDAIYRSGNEGAIQELTNLLKNALCNRSELPLAALRKFLGSPSAPREPQEPAIEVNVGLVQQARLFINGKNAFRVEGLINGYENSEPDSPRRLVCEDMLRDFVSRQQNIQVMKGHMQEARQLVQDTRSEGTKLRSSFKTLSSRTATGKQAA
jgi:hypothetical protein